MNEVEVWGCEGREGEGGGKASNEGSSYLISKGGKRKRKRVQTLPPENLEQRKRELDRGGKRGCNRPLRQLAQEIRDTGEVGAAFKNFVNWIGDLHPGTNDREVEHGGNRNAKPVVGICGVV